jgi:hypothetical protein
MQQAEVGGAAAAHVLTATVHLDDAADKHGHPALAVDTCYWTASGPTCKCTRG